MSWFKKTQVTPEEQTRLLPAYSGTGLRECTKCGQSILPTTKYQPRACQLVSAMAAPIDIIENMIRQCPECGYVWHEGPVDKQ